jgi:cation diffusion facilitator family transporter
MAGGGSRTAVVAALIGNALIAVAKFFAAAITGSAAMLAEGIHSVADVGNQGMLLWGLGAAKRDGGTQHPFGRGKEVYFWSFMVAVMLFVGGSVFSIQHGISALQHPHELANFAISVWVLSGSILIEGFSFTVAIREFNHVRGSRSIWRSVRDTKDSALLVVLLEDSAAMAGLLAALGGIVIANATGNPAWDAWGSIVIGVLLAIVAFVLAYETKALLVGEAASRRDRASIRSSILSHPKVERVGRILTMHMGPSEILVNIDVDLVDGLRDTDAESTIDDIESSIRTVLPGAKNIFVELESVRD